MEYGKFFQRLTGVLISLLICFFSFANAGELLIKWDPNVETDLAGYKIYYGTSSRNYSVILDVENSTNYLVTNLTEGITYFFAVTAYDTVNNESDYSEEVSAMVEVRDTTAPNPPTILGYEIDGLKINIRWSNNSENDLAGYKVYYGTSSANYTHFTDVGVSTSYTTPDLESGIKYYFIVTAYDNSKNESAYSTEVEVMIPVVDNVPPSPPVMSRLENEGRKVHIFWNSVVVPDLEGYKVYYGTSSRNYDIIEDVGNVTNFITSDLSEEMTYYFAVTAYDTANNESNFSNELTADIPIIDITPPTIYAVDIRESTLVNLVFSEPVEKSSAEQISNYHIDHSIQILNISLDNNQRMVHITTTPHQSGFIYTLTVNNVNDLAENANVIASNTTCTYRYSPEDQTPPFIVDVEVIDATHINVNFSEDIDRVSAELEQNYSISNGIIVNEAILDNNLRFVHLTTSAHQNNTTYTLTVNNINDRAPIPNTIDKNSTKQYTYYEIDNIPPSIYEVNIKVDNKVDITFTEKVDQSSAENIQNYTIDNGISVLNAILDNNLQVVHLTTTQHQQGIIYALVVNNVKDLTYPPNEIKPNSSYSYMYAPEDKIQPSIIFVNIYDGNHVDITFSEDIERESAENEINYHINNGISIIEAVLDNNRRVVHLTTTAHTSGQTYLLTVNNVSDRAAIPNVIKENTTVAYTYILEDNTPPTIVQVVAFDANTVEVIFSEIVDRLSAENSENYSIDNGIHVLSGLLCEDLKTVHLKTTTHEPDKTYTLTVNNIKDRAFPPNVIELNSTFQYDYISGTTSDRVIVSNFSKENYQVGYLKVGDCYYVDRSYIIQSIPNELQGLLWIKTANEDRSDINEDFFSFDINKNASIYIAYDSRANSVPNWLQDNFKPLDKYIGVSEYAERLKLWKKDCNKGRINVGGNLAEGAHGSESMYVILVNVNKGDIPPELIDTSDPKSLGPANVFLLFQNYPNPFNAGTEIRYQLPEDCFVTLTVYNIIGQTVRKLVQGEKQASHHIVHWDGRNSNGKLVPSGVYFSRIEVIRKTSINGKNINQVVYSDVRKMLYLK